MTPLKPTIVNGAWVYLPPPPQDIAWLNRQQSPPPPLSQQAGRNRTMTTDNGGPAFPLKRDDICNGMSLRDWFAGQALSGLLSQANGTAMTSEKRLGAAWAYKMADAMIAERLKP